MSNSIYIFTNTFPYGYGETFIDNEVIYWNQFDRVYIIPFNHNTKLRYQNITNKTSIITIPPLSILSKCILCLKVIFHKEFYKEFFSDIYKKKQRWHKLRRLIGFMGHGLYIEKYLRSWIRSDQERGDKIILYSYWLNENSYAASLLSREFHIPAVSRAHRYDIYIEHNPIRYLPLRNYLGKYLYGIYPISKTGESYLKHFLPFQNKLHLFRLGTWDQGIAPNPLDSETLHIVSCSWLVNTKRIDRIIDALYLIKNKNIVYTHIGDGPMMKQLKQRSKCLPTNIQVEFKGALTQSQIFKLYKETPFHYFINVSDIEGISVAIMEAMSFGIPVIATDVGASSEIVVDGYNGYLLNAKYTPEQLANIIISIPYNNKLRKNARCFWQNNFNAEINYKEFFTHISSLL